MTNQERRAALATARRYALDHAELAEANARDGRDHAKLATMWASIADALKDGDPAHDSVTTLPGDFDLGVTTR